MTSEEYVSRNAVQRHRALKARMERDLVEPGQFIWEAYFDVLTILTPSRKDLDIEAIIREGLATCTDLLCKYNFDLSHKVNAGCVTELTSFEEPIVTVNTRSPSLVPTVQSSVILVPGVIVTLPSQLPLLLSENGTIISSFTVELISEPLSRVWINFTSKSGLSKCNSTVLFF